ncbi:tyrosine-type recombinase/integrase [Cereibacter azotoformans]|uniref:tyrosine-type recombinase/integrase n=1 Tax=Cereibacter azotoformans TaxID=43057 RepID=UPI000C6D2C78|nr:site-specific integrase [Cereibacter azotoformans]
MPLTLYQRGEIWHYRGTVAGRRLRSTTGTADKKLAQRIAAEAEASAWRSHLDGPRAHVTMAQAAIAYREAGKATRFLEPIEDHWKDTPLREITGEAVRQTCRKLYPKAKPATWNRQVIAPTMAIINFAAELGWCGPIRVKRFKTDPKSKIPATREWVNAFATQATKDKLPHLAALCLFMFGTGARIGEAVALTWADIDLAAARATIRQTKTSHTRTAHMQPRVVAALANIPGNRSPADLVFGYAARGSVKQVWSNVVERAGIDSLTPHCCRHGFATTMLQAGVDVKTVAVRGGWKDASIVLRTYAHALEDESVTNAVFDTNLARGGTSKAASAGKRRGNAK